MKNSTKLLITLFGISLLFSGGIQAFGQEWTAEQKEVWQMEIKYWDTIQARDVKGHMELWHKDFIGWPYWATKPVGKDDIAKKLITWYTLLDSYQITPEAINRFDKYAIIYYRSSWSGSSGVSSAGRVGHFWMKQDGKWQIIGGYNDDY